MSTTLTRVPPDPPPSVGRPVRWLIPLADLTMRVLCSRPPSGSLATTRVTPATLALSHATGVICLVSSSLLLGSGLSHQDSLQVAVGVALLPVSSGAASVWAVGAGQRRGLRRRERAH